ncbi:hypothetical protein BJX66DRAFT_300435 [Aspergillus keveii]|uniref:Uncharacterized protein n=1 Tax=Aspergillus keveii TaxID=714993 RepID=A0ABR4GBY2_9EURO
MPCQFSKGRPAKKKKIYQRLQALDRRQGWLVRGLRGSVFKRSNDPGQSPSSSS